jgi:hypothetical protein
MAMAIQCLGMSTIVRGSRNQRLVQLRRLGVEECYVTQRLDNGDLLTLRPMTPRQAIDGIVFAITAHNRRKSL